MAVGGHGHIFVLAFSGDPCPERVNYTSGGSRQETKTRTEDRKHKRACAEASIPRRKHTTHSHASHHLVRVFADDAAREHHQHLGVLLERVSLQLARGLQVPAGEGHHRAAHVYQPLHELLLVLRDGTEVPAPAHLDDLLRQADLPAQRAHQLQLGAEWGDEDGEPEKRQAEWCARGPEPATGPAGHKRYY